MTIKFDLLVGEQEIYQLVLVGGESHNAYIHFYRIETESGWSLMSLIIIQNKLVKKEKDLQVVGYTTT